MKTGSSYDAVSGRIIVTDCKSGRELEFRPERPLTHREQAKALAIAKRGLRELV